jgi:hypothetical protein
MAEGVAAPPEPLFNGLMCSSWAILRVLPKIRFPQGFAIVPGMRSRLSIFSMASGEGLAGRSPSG